MWRRYIADIKSTQRLHTWMLAAIGAALLLAALLSGCVTAEEQARIDDSKCQGYGAQLGSPAYIQCRAQLDAAKTQAKAVADATPMPPSMSLPRPTPSPTYSRAP
jgi:hypothetical protein